MKKILKLRKKLKRIKKLKISIQVGKLVMSNIFLGIFKKCQN